MIKIRRYIALGFCGLMLGGVMASFSAAPATARIYRQCDKKVEKMEEQAARDYEKGKLSADDYAKVMAEVAYHRVLWGC